jgi:LuxR family quorum sensing-dependent transcriptional regulator
MLARVMDRVGEVLAAQTPQQASERFYAIMAREGATYLQTRLYRRPEARLTSASHWAAGGFVTRISPERWPGSAAFQYVCFDNNPLLGAIRENRTRYRFSDFAPRDAKGYGAYWDALSEAGIGDALCATSYGAGGRIASVHLGFEGHSFAPEEERAIQLGGLVLTERLLEFEAKDAERLDPLTPRERDALALVADGKTDWEVSVILGVAEATARFHIDNGRRKLGAVNRAQAVARMANRRLI